MIAAVLNELPATTLELTDLATPGPSPGGVLVAVSACGVCGTDLHVMAGESYRPTLPFVLGHEFAGTVTAVAGPGESDLLGRRVVPTLFVGCGACPPCHAGDERLCEAGAQIVGVLGYYGGFAGYVALGADQLVELPATVPDEVGASLVDSGATAHNAVRSALAASPFGQARHLVLGGGPVGLLAAELLVLAGDPVVVVETNPTRRAVLAERMLVAAQSVTELDGSFTTVLDCAGSPGLMGASLERLRPHGLYLAVGYSKVPELDLSLVARRELQIRGIRSGRRADLEDVLALVGRGQLAPPPITTWPLARINDALASLRAGEVAGKAVILVGPRSTDQAND
jgi:2-desacetyl-2-hydroxyethyl bacteriochlorophyllide A dehydrogenase